MEIILGFVGLVITLYVLYYVLDYDKMQMSRATARAALPTETPIRVLQRR